MKKPKVNTKSRIKKKALFEIGTPFQVNLSALMQDRGLTYKDVASMADVPQSTVFGWANGASPIDISAIHLLSKKLNVDFQWLLTGEKSAKDLTGLKLEDYYDEDFLETEGIYKVKLYKLIPKSHKLPSKKG